ncbi:MAG: replicative DNA helicase [Spirochaetaceae bacterium]|jgi:replicative DNA helicase|nr:replicative DNA helicase [Spirochaetaceae bacterium]
MPLSLNDRVPPHNEDAERAALGSMLLDREAVSTAKFTLKPEDFYTTANALVYEAVLGLDDAGGVRADIITVADALRKNGKLDAAGGEPYISALTNVVSSSANIEHYAQIVKELSMRRSLIRISAELSADAYDTSKDTKDILSRAQDLIFELVTQGESALYKELKSILKDAYIHIEQRMKNKNAFIGVPSGFTRLDEYTQGFQNSEMIVIGARPSLGKTALALNMAVYAADKAKTPAAFFSLEMSDMALALRMLSAEAGIDSYKLKTGFMDTAMLNQLITATGRLYDLPMYIIDRPNMKLFDLCSTAMRLKAEKNIGIIFIDYLQLIVTDNGSKRPDWERVSEISREIKGLAKKLNIPVVALSQVGRDSEGNRPTLRDLRGSGAIEQDADVLIFLHRDRVTDKQSDGPPPEDLETELIVAKNRNGAVGECKIIFRSKYTQFLNKQNG